MPVPALISHSEASRLRALCETLRDARRSQLRSFLASADIVDDATVPLDVVATDVSFRCLDTSCNEIIEFTLVERGRADLAAGRICSTSTMGLAFLGRRRGDVVVCPTLVGVEMAFEILEVVGPTDAGRQPVAAPQSSNLAVAQAGKAE
jgi:transcription elongation GreA/GreB family factor